VVAIPSGRYFGFVIGGAVSAALAADWLTSTWDQNAGLYVGGPSASVVEETAGAWLKDLLGIPAHASFAFVTGCQMANFTALAIARWHLLSQAGWDVNTDGLAGSPRIRVLCGEKVHVTVTRALRLLGLGTPEPVAADDQGRMIPEALRDALRGDLGPMIVCAQAGEVNTGAFDTMPEISLATREAGVWLHVDGAFGLWAAASATLSYSSPEPTLRTRGRPTHTSG
jgi:glutamate/tyrosine decarboxylase-like PLP-dependent enzyme